MTKPCTEINTALKQNCSNRSLAATSFYRTDSKPNQLARGKHADYLNSCTATKKNFQTQWSTHDRCKGGRRRKCQTAEQTKLTPPKRLEPRLNR